MMHERPIVTRQGETMEKQKGFEAFLEAGGAFGERRLWERFTNFDCIGLRLGAGARPMLASIMGDAGEQFGLMLIRGDDPAGDFETITRPGGPGGDGIEAVDLIGLNLDPFGELDTESQNWFRRNGRHPKARDVVPCPMVKRAYKLPGLPTNEDLALLTWVLRAIVAADTAAPLEPAELDDPDGVAIISMADKSTTPMVTREPWPCPVSTPAPGQAVSLSLDTSELERLDTTYLVGMTPMPISIEGDNRSLQLLLVADDPDGRSVQCKPVFAGDLQEAADALAEAFHGRTMLRQAGGLPREVVFTNRNLHDALKPVLAFAGVKCHYEPSIPRLEALATNFIEFLIEHSPSEFGLEDDPDDAVPAEDDLAAWKQADRNLAQRFAAFLDDEDGRLWSSRAISRYLGHTDLEGVLEEFGKLGAAMAYCSWGVLDYRPTRKSKTQAEKMIEAGLPVAQEALLRARVTTPPSLHRVGRLDPKAGTVEMEDILLGGTRTVHDQLFSENTERGLVFVGRVFPAGAFCFMEPIGPPLGARMLDGAIDVLRDEGMMFTAEGLLDEAHKFGRLWAWFEDYRDNPPRPILCNTDGDLLVPHTASFAVDDEGRARRALTARDDVNYHEDLDEYTWDVADAPGVKTVGGPVLMARMSFVAGELVVEVNSARRLERIRGWIERIPGVRFLNAESRPWDLPENARPLDGRLGPDNEPMALAPEMIEQLTDHFRQHYMDWLDMPLPALNGRTPREACRTEIGRQEVAILIRTIPDPVSNAGVDIPVPRQAMLRELGIETAPETPDDHLASPGPIHAALKVGRNDPCPCGSGRKYKKCCGR